MPQNSLRLAFRRATSLIEGGKAASPHESVKYNLPLHQLRTFIQNQGGIGPGQSRLLQGHLPV